MSDPHVDRGQSSVVGVAILIGVTMIAIAAIVAGAGTVVESGAANAETAAVARDISDVVDRAVKHPESRTDVRLHGGTVSVTERRIRIRHNGTVILDRLLGGLRYRSATGHGEVRSMNGAVVRRPGGLVVERSPSLTSSPNGTGTLMIGIVDLEFLDTSSIALDGAVTIRTERSVEQVRYPSGSTTIAIESATPVTWAEWLREAGADVRTVSNEDDTGTETVVAKAGNRSVVLVVYTIRVSVSD